MFEGSSVLDPQSKRHITWINTKLSGGGRSPTKETLLNSPNRRRRGPDPTVMEAGRKGVDLHELLAGGLGSF